MEIPSVYMELIIQLWLLCVAFLLLSIIAVLRGQRKPQKERAGIRFQSYRQTKTEKMFGCKTERELYFTKNAHCEIGGEQREQVEIKASSRVEWPTT